MYTIYIIDQVAYKHNEAFWIKKRTSIRTYPKGIYTENQDDIKITQLEAVYHKLLFYVHHNFHRHSTVF